ncbi:MAG: hypothetical protein RJR37_04370 [Peptococcaceae bacterium MAG4]|nr:hypothetical protein [Peptococcaceae bacterium MAG4]
MSKNIVVITEQVAVDCRGLEYFSDAAWSLDGPVSPIKELDRSGKNRRNLKRL